MSNIPEEMNNEKEKENENMITLKELLSHLESNARIVDKCGIKAVTGDPNILMTVLSDDILNTGVKYIDPYDDCITTVALDFLLKKTKGKEK